MPLFKINENNFFIKSPGGKNKLCISVDGITVVFFKMQGCKGCQTFFPIFQRIAQEYDVNFAILDATENRGVAPMSRNTTTPIETVPEIILYKNGEPIARYKGDRQYGSLKVYVEKCLKLVGNSMQQQSQPNMYGSAAPQHSYHQPSSTTSMYMPDQSPQMPQQQSMGGMQQQQQDCDPDDEECLRLPPGVTPKNKPWEAHLNRH